MENITFAKISIMRIYFDNAATTPIDPEVLEVMTDALKNNYGNPSSIYAEGRQARASIEQARKTVAHLLNASIGEVFFTSGGTESNNMILKGAVRDLGVKHIISSPTEHHCILHSLNALKRDTDVKISQVEIDDFGRPKMESLEAILSTSTEKTLVSLMHSNNETGAMIDLDVVGDLCAQYGALFHSDTVQTIGYFPIDVSKTKVHFISGSSHKFYGPKFNGFVYINGDHILNPYIDGGSQERNMRAGTESIHGILGLAKAFDLAVAKIDERREQASFLRDMMRQEIEQNFPDAIFNTPTENAHYKVLSVGFPDSPKAALLLFNLDIAGISVSGGSACASGVNTGSHVMRAIDPDSPYHTVRFSFSHHNTEAEVHLVIKELKKILG